MPTPKDIDFMQAAIALAERAGEAGEVPVGAIVVCQGEVVGRGWNRPITAADPCAHAEIIALREAAERADNYRLPECDIYVTLEPCTMCVGAIVHARIKRLIFAAHEPKAGVIVSNGNLLEADYLNHRVQWEGGVCAEQSAQMLQDFFKKRREEKRQQKAEKNKKAL
jgi:tRNA(adenine34) deaminase